jgi:hypothetical protein
MEKLMELKTYPEILLEDIAAGRRTWMNAYRWLCNHGVYPSVAFHLLTPNLTKLMELE